MIQVQVAVAADRSELSDRKIGLLRDEMGQQRIGSDVERYAEEDIGAALIKLAGQPAARDVKLEERVTGRQLHARDVAHIPGGNDKPARIRVLPDLREQVRELVNVPSVGRGPRPPLVAVDGPEIALRVRPF